MRVSHQQACFGIGRVNSVHNLEASMATASVRQEARDPKLPIPMKSVQIRQGIRGGIFSQNQPQLFHYDLILY